MEEEIGGAQAPVVGANSPFMSFDDFYHTAGSRANSSFEEFWEQRQTTSSGEEMGTLPRRSVSNLVATSARTVRTMTMPEFRISSLTRLSSLSVSSLSRASDLGLDGHGADDASTTSRPLSFVSRVVTKAVSKRRSSLRPDATTKQPAEPART